LGHRGEKKKLTIIDGVRSRDLGYCWTKENFIKKTVLTEASIRRGKKWARILI